MEGVYIIVYISILLMGLCIGSFLNVLIYRLPLGMSIVSPPSHCPKCDALIKWYDNIPLLSYIILRGKCRHCKEKISPKYFVVELVNLLLYALVLYTFKLSFMTVVALLAASILLAIFFIDFEHQIIPDSLNIALVILGAATTVFSVFYPVTVTVLGDFSIYWWEHLVGGVGGGLVFLLIYLVYYLVRKKEGLGGGDIKYIAAVGLILGYKLTILTIGLSALIACIYLLIMQLIGKLNAENPIPYGPFLSIATFISIMVGNYLINLYLSLF